MSTLHRQAKPVRSIKNRKRKAAKISAALSIARKKNRAGRPPLN